MSCTGLSESMATKATMSKIFFGDSFKGLKRRSGFIYRPQKVVRLNVEQCDQTFSKAFKSFFGSCRLSQNAVIIIIFSSVTL